MHGNVHDRRASGGATISTWNAAAAPAGLAAAFALAATVAHGQTDCSSTGPDVIVGEIVGVDNYASTGGVEAFAVGTTSCNIGDEELLWISQGNQHPVIGQNIFRLKDGRFEQVGQAWLKHGFAALQGNACGCGCIPSGPAAGSASAARIPTAPASTATRTASVPKFEVNAYTGVFELAPVRLHEHRQLGLQAPPGRSRRPRPGAGRRRDVLRRGAVRHPGRRRGRQRSTTTARGKEASITAAARRGRWASSARRTARSPRSSPGSSSTRR